MTTSASNTTPTNPARYAFPLNSAAADHIVLTAAPSPNTALFRSDLTATLKDAFGNDATRGAATVLTPASSSTGAAKAFKTTGGTAQSTFTITAGSRSEGRREGDEKAGWWSITLTNDGSLTNPAAHAFTVNAAAADHIVLTGASSSTAGVNSGDLTATLKDAFGNDATRGADTVITPASSSTGSNKAFKTTGGTTQSTFTITAGSSSVSFKYYDEKAGSWSITLTNDGSLTNPSAYAFTVDPAAAAALAYQVQPTDVTAGVAIAPAVKVKVTDAFGNTVTGDTSNVTVALTTAGGATLSGTKTQAASTGVATFNDLSVDKT